LQLRSHLEFQQKKILSLYFDKANDIFGEKRIWFRRWTYWSKYSNKKLEANLKETFRKYFGGKDPTLADCLVPVCIPIFDLSEGKPRVLKSKYHPEFNRDYHLPAYQAALATSAAPTFFDPFSDFYQKIGSGLVEPFSNKVDVES